MDIRTDIISACACTDMQTAGQHGTAPHSTGQHGCMAGIGRRADPPPPLQRKKRRRERGDTACPLYRSDASCNAAGGRTPAGSLDRRFAAAAASRLRRGVLLHKPYLHESAHSKQIQIDYRSIDRCSNPPPLPSLLCPFSVLTPSLPSRQNQGASEKMVCGVQTAAPIRYDTDSESPSPAGSARKHGAALSSRQSTAASPQNSVPDGASRRW